MASSLEDKVVLVTGGSGGIGAAVVRGFASAGCKVYLTYRSSPEEAKKIVSSAAKPGRVFCLSCDVRKKEEVESTVETILAKEERLDVLVNNAGIIRDSLFLTL